MLDCLRKTELVLGPLLATFVLGLATLALSLWYSYRKQSYWKKVGIPYVKPLPFVGSAFDNIAKPLHEVDLFRYRTLGRIHGYYEGNKPLLAIGDPEILRKILVKDFQAFTGRRIFDISDKTFKKVLSIVRGEDWKRIRTIVTPTFTTGKIKRMKGIFKECTQTLLQNFNKAEEKPVEVKGIYGAFSMDVIASSAFSTKIDSHNDPGNPFVQNARKIFARNISWRLILFLISPRLMKFLGIPPFNPEVRNFFANATLQIIEERRRTGQTRNDFLQLLLDTSKEVTQNEKQEGSEKDDIVENYGKQESHQMFKQNIYSKKTLSQDEIIAQCLIFFLAGYDTTASTLSFASYQLALNPDIQEKLIQEVDNADRDQNGDLTYEAIQGMKYLDNVIAETLRLYPPSIRLERLADEDYKLEDIGLVIPKGTIVTIPVYAIHRDPELYPDPEKFDPDRFTLEERAKRNPYAYMPFGHGPRNCVGMRFALMEVKVCLSDVLSSFRIKKCSETKVPLDFYMGQGLLSPKDIMLTFEARKDRVKATSKS